MKNLTFLKRVLWLLIPLLTLFNLNAWGTEEVIYTLDGSVTDGTNGYATLSEDISITNHETTIVWNAVGNTTQNPWRIGGQSLTNVVRPVYSETAISENVTKVVVSYGSTFNLTSASAVLKVYSTAAAAASGGSTNLISTVNGDDGTNAHSNAIGASKTHTFARPNGNDWTGRYFRFEFTCTYKLSSNKYFQLSSANFYADVETCTKIGAPTVTATPGDRTITLTWANQTGASSYSVTKTPAGGSVGTPSKSGSTWSCAITGLTNGTTYTWSVEAVGSGDYCASGNTAASASATPNVFRTITYYDKDGQHTTSLADGTNLATALTALYGGDDPVSCDATNYEYFVGWKVGEISGTASSVTLLDDEVVNASSPSNNYYAVWSDTDPSAGGWTKVTSIAVGDVVVFAYDDDYKEMTGVTTTGTTYGSAAAVDPYPDDLSGDYALTVEAGNGGTGFSFKHGSDYLSWSSGNSLTTSGTKNNASSWTVSSSSGNFKFANVGDATRILQYNSGSPRWACYTSSQKAFQIYKQSGGGDAEYITTCGSAYTITLAGSPAGTVTGGTFSASAASASAGTVITLTATPTRGYEFGSWTVTDASSNPVSVSNNQFTMPASNVTVSATFNTATPLTITLSTNSKGTFTNPDPWPIYSGESFTFPDVTPNDPSCATFVGWIEGTTFVGDGTTHDAPVTIAAGSSSGAQSSNTTYTAVFYETETTETDAYVKVTSAPASWANDHYLIVYEGDATHAAVAFDGKRDNGDNGNIDAVSNGVEVTITNDAIAKTARLAAAEWRIAAVTGGHSIQSASGFYIGQTTDANGLQTNSSTAYVNTLAYSSGFSVTGSGNAVLRYNYASDQLRFRYYKSSSYSSQQVIQLYKLGTAEVQTRTYTTNPSCTPKYRVTVASVTGGSPNADPRYNPESTEVSLTANPSAGYAFTGWTITKTTGGDNVTTTLLPGAKATTANTTFSMPAYDVTVTATYAKKMVTELKVMDGSTVVANTTGPVSGTLNVSTGANKTLDVVITPADAFDHSWTASVTAGGTYASISNVTAEGFRVNGLAQGDATITVTASNDEANGGTPKVVTFTVHVTDILPEEIILKRDGSSVEISELTMYYDAANTQGQYVKVNVSYSPANPTNKAFTFSSAATGKVGSHSHAPANGYEVLVANGVTVSPVNCTFTSSADGSVTKVLAVTVLPILTDVFIDYIHGNATQRVSARLSADRYTMITDINTPSLPDASDAEPASADCETSHYHLIGWLPQATAEALWAAGTPITEATEGLVRAGVQVEATGQTWYAIWGKEAE